MLGALSLKNLRSNRTIQIVSGTTGPSLVLERGKSKKFFDDSLFSHQNYLKARELAQLSSNHCTVSDILEYHSEVV
jgi:hypothetical protein